MNRLLLHTKRTALPSMTLLVPLTLVLLLLVPLACSKPVETVKTSDTSPSLFPDYIGVTIPPNIAPLNFKITEPMGYAQAATFEGNGIKFDVRTKNGQFQIPGSRWTALLKAAAGNEFMVTVRVRDEAGWTAYAPFKIKVAKEPVDPYLVYRLIEPGYETWNEMGIYQRNLETFTQSPILENKTVEGDCMNCHSFCMQDPNQMMLHIRGVNGGTMVAIDGKVEKLNTKTQETMSALVYPSWHPSGRFIAFSVNNTKQDFHSLDRNRVEVYDLASDVVLYDVENHKIFTTAALFSEERFETFPSFSPDGKSLYFSTAEAYEMPDEYQKVKYSLCRINFDPETKQFGTFVDTLFNARLENRSAAFPRVSPNGKYLLYAKGDYGGFFIWHKEADLFIYNMETDKHYPLTMANSNDVESYHSWSSNSRWIVYASRRIDGLYSRPFIAYINDKGEAEKAFLVPQKKAEFYDHLMKSYNVPEFVTGKVRVPGYKISHTAKTKPGIDVTFKEQQTPHDM
jgi:hypothetical protein